MQVTFPAWFGIHFVSSLSLCMVLHWFPLGANLLWFLFSSTLFLLHPGEVIGKVLLMQALMQFPFLTQCIHNKNLRLRIELMWCMLCAPAQWWYFMFFMDRNDSIIGIIYTLNTFTMGLSILLLVLSYARHESLVANFGPGFLFLFFTENFVHAYDAWYISTNFEMPVFIVLTQALMYLLEKTEFTLVGGKVKNPHLFVFCRVVSLSPFLSIPIYQALGLHMTPDLTPFQGPHFDYLQAFLALYSMYFNVCDILRVCTTDFTHPAFEPEVGSDALL